MKRKTLLTIIAVIGAILGVFGTAFGLSINVPGFMAALGAILVYVFFEAKADIARISAQAAKWKDPKFWITVISGVLGALAEPGEEERKGLVEHFDKHISFVIGGKDACPTCVKIRDLINQNFHLYLLVFFLSEENKKKTR